MPDESKRVKISIYGKNDWNGDVKDLKFFLKFDSPEILSLTRRIIWAHKDTLEKIDPMLRKFYQAKFLFDELSKIITYVSDPSLSLDKVQYPEETLKLHTGDCDDLAVLYASMLGSVEIEFAFVDVRAMRQINESHVLYPVASISLVIFFKRSTVFIKVSCESFLSPRIFSSSIAPTISTRSGFKKPKILGCLIFLIPRIIASFPSSFFILLLLSMLVQQTF